MFELLMEEFEVKYKDDIYCDLCLLDMHVYENNLEIQNSRDL